MQCASLRQCSGNKRVGEQTACARQKPVQGRVFHLLRQLMWKVEVPLRHGLHQSGAEKSPAFQSECRDFSMGQFARCCASLQQCAGRERVGQAGPADPSAVGWHCEGESRASKKPQRTDFSTLCGPPGGKQRAPRGQKKPAVPVEQPVLNRQTQALWLAASMASIIAARTPASSMARMPRMVVPPGEQTLSLSAPGCRPLSSSILPAPITVWAASS